MDKTYFLKLLQKYLDGQSTEEERKFLLSYYALFESEPEIVALMSKVEKDDLEYEMQTVIWENITDRNLDKSESKSKYRRLIITASAAAAMLVFFIGYYFVNRDNVTEFPVVHNNKSVVHRLIHLPDGSTVLISAGSKLNYPSSFDNLKSRDVYLSGEAYFDIKHNAGKPFIVHTGKIKTTVLGTAFNIKAYPDNGNITVTVTRGKVKVDDVSKTLAVISPTEQVVYRKTDSDIVKRVVKLEEVLEWKEQDIQLENVTVEEAVDLLEERFKVRFIFTTDQLKLKRFTTVFLKTEPLENILKSICEFNDAVYTYSKENATVVLSNKTETKEDNIN